MKLIMEHDFGWPLEEIAPLLANEELVDFEDLPNVSKRKMIERRREGDKIFKVMEWNVHGQIPKAAQKIVRPEMLTFTEYTDWDDNTHCFNSRIEPHFLKHILNVSTKSRWSAAGPRKAHRRIEMSLEVHIPIIGPMLERSISDHLKKNTEKSTEVLKGVFTRRLGPQTIA